MKKRFIPQIGNNNTVKIFDASTGQLYKIINVGGEIISQPICLETELYVTIKGSNGKSLIKYFNLPSGSLKRVQSV